MLFKLIIVVILCFAVAGIVLFLNRFVFRGRLPKWVLPVGVAGAILGYHIFDEYNWHSRKLAGFAQMGDIEIYKEIAPRDIWRPWSYIKAPVLKMEVFDKAQMQDYGDGIYLALVTRVNNFGTAEAHRPVAYDCKKGRAGDLLGEVEDTIWHELAAADYERLCAR